MILREVALARLEEAGRDLHIDMPFLNGRRDQGLAMLAERGELRDMSQAVKIDIGATEYCHHIESRGRLPFHPLFEPGDGQCARWFRDRIEDPDLYQAWRDLHARIEALPVRAG